MRKKFATQLHKCYFKSMEDRDDYGGMLEESGLGYTGLREAVLMCIGESGRPLSVREILSSVRHKRSIDKATCYRILDRLVQYGLVERLSTGDRAFRYGLAELSRHLRHPHFFCLKCGAMSCLEPIKVGLDIENIQKNRGCTVEKIELRLDGICEQCRKESL